MPNHFYVYELIDPRNGIVFYVGKGQRARAWQHESDVKNGRKVYNKRKSDLIAEILASGNRPEVHIVAEYDEEADAYEHEVELIASTSNLTNILAGGSGGWSLSKEEAERRNLLRQERIKRRKQIKNRIWLADWLSQAEQWGGVTFPGIPNGDQMAEEYLVMVKKIVTSPMPQPI